MKSVKGTVLLILLLPLALVICSFVPATGDTGIGDQQQEQGVDTSALKREYTNKEDNEACLKCHGRTHFEYKAEGEEKVYKKKMFSEAIIDTVAYYSSNHWNFMCVDCHSSEYLLYPHKGELRFEEMLGCMDCHGGDDPQYAHFQFDKISEEFQKSVHFTKQPTSFTCWSCHDGHYYKINARNRKNDIKGAIQYDNNICLGCHANIKNYQMIVDKLNPNILEKHDWLPNQANHFKSVRCIDCHTEIASDMMVAHNVRTKDKAVKKCAECHSSNSELMASLYKYQLQSKGRLKLGDAFILDEPVLIGGKRNVLLKLFGNIAVLLTLIGVSIHAVIRIYSKK